MILKHQETKDAELLALTAVVNAIRSQRDAANARRLDQGHALAYDDDVPWPELDALHAELLERGILEKAQKIGREPSCHASDHSPGLNNELTRLRAIRDAVTAYDGHQSQAAIDEEDECWADAEEEEERVKKALEQVLQLTRNEVRK